MKERERGMMERGPELTTLIDKVTRGASLSAGEAEGAFRGIMAGEASPVEIGAFLAALRTKGVEPAEVAGGVRALRGAMVPVRASDPEALVDTCGTGGGRVSTFNISTAAAIAAAGAGVRIAKHGNRSFTSRSGSADVLEALGVEIELEPGPTARILEEVGVVFMYAPRHHPAMRHVGPVRRELRIPTVMNLLGPLTNPAGARRQVVGVSDPEVLGLVVRSLAELGHVRALVVHGEPGMDELSPSGPSRVAELRDGAVEERTVTPEEVGLERAAPESLKGGGPEENAAIIRRILGGEEEGGAAGAVFLNAGAAIYVAGRAASLAEGVEEAREAVASGAAAAKLEALRRASRAEPGRVSPSPEGR